MQSFEAAIGMDSYLAVAYFQSGVSNFLLGQYEAARRDFEDTYSVSGEGSGLAERGRC